MPLTRGRATVEASNIAGGKVVMEIAETRGGQRWRIFGWGFAVALLAAPFVAMRMHAQGVDWSPGDFVFAAVIFATVGGLLELAVRLTRSRLYRGATALALLGGLLVVWANLAVGIVGSEHNPDNQLFFVALLMGIAGAIGARFKADGMKRAMITTAVAIVVVFAIAESGRPDEPMVHPLVEGVGTSIFVLLFVGSAWLFRKAATRQSSSSS
jgi:energy-converting hydrogenase Eha subunit C